jgi:hypothetical protein
MHKLFGRISTVMGAALLAAASATAAVAITGNGAEAAVTKTSFQMVPAKGVVGCLPAAHANVTIVSQGPVDVMKVSAAGLPPDTNFALFVTQVPNAPFGISLYLGDLDTGRNGHAHGTFVGRFSIETFAVAPGVAPAPVVFNGPFPDASSNPPTNPVQLYHLGLWFNSPKDAAAAGCPATVTPFNAEHDAGIQALNTSNFPINSGPLRQVSS